MKYADINKRFTETVAEYIAKGYAINTMSMRGSQGEITKIDMTDGKEIIRIKLDTFYEWKCGGQGIELTVGRVNGKVKPHMNDDRVTVWNKELEVLTSEKFYGLDAYGSDYYGTLEEAKAAWQKRYERAEAKYTGAKIVSITSASALEIAERIVRDRMGYKRVNRSEINLTKNRESGRYMVSYHGKKCILH